MTPQEQAVDILSAFQRPLSVAYAHAVAGASGITLPGGEVSDKYGMAILTDFHLKSAQEVNNNPELSLHLFSDEVTRQLTINKFCLVVVLARGENTAEYFALHECSLVNPE